MSIRNRSQSIWEDRDWSVWEVLGRSMDFLFYAAIAAFLFALVFEPARSSFLLVLVPALLAFLLGLGSVVRD